MPRLTPTPEQDAAIEQMRSEPTRACLQISELGTGKAQPLSEPVLTPLGWTAMGDLAVGSEVIGSDGRPTRVTGVYPQGVKPVFKVLFSDGSYTYTTGDHLWAVRIGKSRNSPLKLRTTNDLAMLAGKVSQFVPLVEPVKWQARGLPMDPYLLGVLLGDGAMSVGMVALHTDKELIDSLILPTGWEFGAGGPNGPSWSVNIRGAKELLRTLSLYGKKSEEKFIPKDFLLSSVTDRVSLLQGLNDTDGTPSRGYAVEWGSVSEELTLQYVDLVQSLGGTAKVSTKIPTYAYKGAKLQGQKFYRVYVTWPNNLDPPFRLKRKLEDWHPAGKYLPRRKVIEVTYSHEEECQCIKVEALDSLYVTRNFLLTHNTLMAVELALRLGAKQLLVIAPVGTHKGWEATLEGQGWPHPVRPITTKTPENHAALVAGEPGAYLVGREFFYLSANAAPPKETKVEHTYKDGVLSGVTKADEIVLAYPNNSVHVPVENGEFSFKCPRPSRVVTVSRGRKARWVWTKAKPDLVVNDEGHSGKNRYGLMFETLKTLPKSAYRLVMSATPQGSHFDGIWAVTRWLWPEYPGPVDRSKQRWVAEWCAVEEVVTGKDERGELTTVQKVLGEKNPGAFLRSLPCVVKVEAEKKPYEEYNVYVTLSEAHKAVWDEMAETSIAWMNDNPTVAKLPMEKRLRLRQMALAMPDIGEEGEVGFVPDAESPKLNAALKIQARHPGEAILYVTDSAKFARIAAPRLGAKLLVGGMKKADRDWLVNNLGVEYNYLVATYGAVAEGCFTPDVEVMTDRGFVRLDSLAGGEKVLCQEGDEPAKFRDYTKVEIPYDGDLSVLRLQGEKLPVTGTHKFDFWDYKKKTWSVVDAATVRNREGSIPASLNPTEDDAELTALEQLYIATQADGSLGCGDYFTAGFMKDRKIKRFKALLENSGVAWKQISNGSTKWRVSYRVDPRCKRDLASVFDIPTMSCIKAKLVLGEMAEWDGHREKDGSITFRSTNEDAIVFYERVAAIACYSTVRGFTRPETENWNSCYSLRVFPTTERRYAQYGRLDRKSHPPEHFEGTLHCVNVGSRKCVFRRGRNVFVARNTDGLQLNCHIEVLFNPADGAVPNEQFSGRLNRVGQTADRVVRYNLKAKETLDDEHYVRSEFMTKLRRAEVEL